MTFPYCFILKNKKKNYIVGHHNRFLEVTICVPGKLSHREKATIFLLGTEFCIARESPQEVYVHQNF